MDNEVFSLLKDWCDSLIKLQINNTDRIELDGGLLCPACGLMHGRCCDLVYPLVYLYTVTDDEKYVKSAEMLSDWAESNLKDRYGLYRNDFNTDWIGVSSFHADCLYEALNIGKGKISEALYKKLYDRFISLTDIIYSWFEIYRLNIVTNYYGGGANCLAERFALTGEERFRQRAIEWIETVLERTSGDGLTVGEGYDKNGKTCEADSHGCYQVDIGYNFEETVNFVIKVGKLLGCEKYVLQGKHLMHTLIDFILPDGGIDNSFGSRSIKWTYYGSRTSDGIACGLALCPEEKLFTEAAFRNFELMKKLTDKGLLYGGAMYREAGEVPCIHHAFEHAKALTAMCVSAIKYRHIVDLPCESVGKADYPSAGVRLVRKKEVIGSFYIGAYDNVPQAVAVGGSLSLMYSRKIGAVIASTVAQYSLAEPKNMQYPKNMSPVYSMNPRIDRGAYSQRFSKEFTAHFKGDTLFVEGKLADARGNLSDTYGVSYELVDNGVKISAECDGGAYVLPIVALKDDELLISGKTATVKRQGGCIKITADSEIKMWLDEDTTQARHFTPTGGFIYAILRVDLKGLTNISVTVE